MAGNTGASALVPNAVLVSGKRAADANIFGFRVGPYLEVPIMKNLSAQVSAGGLLAVLALGAFVAAPTAAQLAGRRNPRFVTRLGLALEVVGIAGIAAHFHRA